MWTKVKCHVFLAHPLYVLPLSSLYYWKKINYETYNQEHQIVTSFHWVTTKCIPQRHQWKFWCLQRTHPLHTSLDRNRNTWPSADTRQSYACACLPTPHTVPWQSQQTGAPQSRTMTHNIHCGHKKMALYFCPYLRQLLTDFQNSLTGALCRQFAIMRLLYIPPPHKCVSTLPCEI